ncbi:Gfo/Idh/MocA family protein [Haloarcula amylovorans]|uniref:Gfo/Idh/MocA family protein n=1 Tax=Haloarcula amylovorans TaxID=2562280 RepID=UPI00107604FF|nr:Gfo/Idh/MocA family oxidoreductase [Halomicroarcula amylolytica]
MSDLSSIRLGFVGLGNIAHLHCDRLQNAGLGALVAAGMDVDPDARRIFAEEYGAEVYEDPDEFYADVDAVLVTTPNKFHEQYVVDALDAGRDVFVEKPLAHTLESAERIADAAADAEGFCMVGFHNRFANPVQALVEYERNGTLGEISHVEADYIRRRGVPGRGSWFTRKPIAGGGSLIDIGAHAIDLSLYLLGYPDVIEVSGETRAQFGTREDYSYLHMWGEDRGASEFSVDDSASAFIRCADGTTITLEVAWASNRPGSQQYYVRGSEAGAGLDLKDHSLELYETATTGAMHHRTTEIETGEDEPHALEQERFLAAVAADEPPGTNTVEQALAVQRVMDAIYRSSEQGCAVSIE